MDKKKDLKLVFDFIADFLREDVDVSPAKPTQVEEEPKAVETPKSKMEQLIESINPQEVKSLIQRVDEMDKLTKEKEDEKRNILQDAFAVSDFNMIKALRNNVTAEE